MATTTLLIPGMSASSTEAVAIVEAIEIRKEKLENLFAILKSPIPVAEFKMLNIIFNLCNLLISKRYYSKAKYYPY